MSGPGAGYRPHCTSGLPHQRVNDNGLALTKEQSDGTTAERHQRVLEVLKPYFSDGMDPGMAAVKADCGSEVESRGGISCDPNAGKVRQPALSAFAQTAAYVRFARQQRAEAIANQRRQEAAGVYIAATTPEMVEIDPVFKWEVVLTKSWPEMQAKRMKAKESAFTPAHPVNGIEPGDWRGRVLCEIDNLLEILGGQHMESPHARYAELRRCQSSRVYLKKLNTQGEPKREMRPCKARPILSVSLRHKELIRSKSSSDGWTI